MEGYGLVDIYSTKGIEYLIAAVFFFGFLALQRYILTSAPGREKSPGSLAGLPTWDQWVELAKAHLLTDGG